MPKYRVGLNLIKYEWISVGEFEARNAEEAENIALETKEAKRAARGWEIDSVEVEEMK
jgi:hypothetical protein